MRERTDTVVMMLVQLEVKGGRRVLLPDPKQMNPDKVLGFGGWLRAVCCVKLQAQVRFVFFKCNLFTHSSLFYLSFSFSFFLSISVICAHVCHVLQVDTQCLMGSRKKDGVQRCYSLFCKYQCIMDYGWIHVELAMLFWHSEKMHYPCNFSLKLQLSNKCVDFCVRISQPQGGRI